MTANGEVLTREEATVYVKEVELFATVMLLEDTPAVLSLGKLCEDHGYTNHWTEWADALSRNKEFIKGFFPPEQRIEVSVNDLLIPGHQPRSVPEHDRWPDQLRRVESLERSGTGSQWISTHLPGIAKC